MAEESLLTINEVDIFNEWQPIPLALQIEDIVEHLFSYLNLEDIKSCRRIGRVWKIVGDTIMRHKTRVVFFFPHPRWQLKRKQMEAKLFDFASTVVFEDRELEDNPFYSFFIGGYQVDSTYVDLCAKFAIYARELIVDIKTRQFAPDNFDMNLFVGENLTSLSICFGEFMRKGDGLNRFELKLKNIPCIEELLLDQCDIDVTDCGNTFSVRKLCLGPNNTYSEDEDELEDFLINQFFNLRFTHFVKIMSDTAVFDFSDCNNKKLLREVHLENIKILNWEKCDWKVKSLNLIGASFLDNNAMVMEEFKIEDGIVDLSKISNPNNVKKLWCTENAEILQWEYLPNLEDVKLENRSIAALPAFANNNNLTTLSLSSKSEEITVNMLNLPMNLKRLQLQAIKIEGNIVISLEKLVLRGYVFADFEQTIKTFRADCLVIYSLGCHRFQNLEIIVSFLRNNNSFKRVMIGDFNWCEYGINDIFGVNDFGFSKFVDKESFCYDIIGKKGIGIDWEAFSCELYNK